RSSSFASSFCCSIFLATFVPSGCSFRSTSTLSLRWTQLAKFTGLLVQSSNFVLSSTLIPVRVVLWLVCKSNVLAPVSTLTTVPETSSTSSSSPPGCTSDCVMVMEPLEKSTTDRKSTRLNSSHQIISYAV